MFFYLLLAFTFVPAVEIALFVRIGSVIGPLATFAVVIATGIAGAGYGLAQAIMNPLLQHICTALGWRNALRIAAGMMLVDISVAAYTMRPAVWVKAQAGATGRKAKVLDFPFFKDPVFLGYVSRGLLWAAGRLDTEE